MSIEINLYGPPGSGKTTRLTRLFAAACARVGPERVAAVTYTRAAADELRIRAAPLVGLQGSLQSLRRWMPWVGTIHSLKYRLLGITGPQVTSAQRYLLGDNTSPGPRWDDDPYDTLSDDASEDTQALWLYGVSRHRMMSYDAFLDSPHVPTSRLANLNRERARYLVREYEAWKHEHRKIDFEDMLTREGGVRLPVRVLICDEVQDNSPLLWSVLDQWGEQVDLRIHAGDPYQAIYSFAGADPQLFRRRESYGKWVTIGDSRRFNEAAATYARAVIVQAHGDDPILRSWKGVGGNQERDGTGLVLARTHALLAAYRADLLDRGTPFREFRGTAPLDALSGQAYKTLYRVRQGDSIAGGELAVVLRAARRLPKRVRDKRDSLDEDRLYSPNAVADVLERSPKAVADLLPYADYFKALVVSRGMRALFAQPKLTISTIHGAKGREADDVTLIRSWGHYPAAAVATALGARDESCVAYVGVTRHRHSFQFVDGLDGQEYPFPSPAAVAREAASTGALASR